MTLLVLVLAVVLLAGEVVATVRRDGYGTLEPPRSHPHDDATPGRPGRPV